MSALTTIGRSVASNETLSGEIIAHPGKIEQSIYLGQAWNGQEWRKIGYPGPRHIMTFGGTGSGKTTSLLVPTLAKRRGSIIVVDGKGGQLAAITARHRAKMGPVKVLNPFDVNLDRYPHLESHKWNPLAQIKAGREDAPSTSNKLAEGCIEHETGGNSKFFEDSAQSVLATFVHWERITRGPKATLRNVRAYQTRPDFIPMLRAMAQSNVYQIRTEAGDLLRRLTSKNSQATSIEDVFSTIKKNTTFLNDDRIHYDMAGGEAIDFKRMHHEVTTIYLILPSTQLEEQSRWLRMFINLALAELLENAPYFPTLPRVLLMLDEFANLGRLSEVIKALNMGRDPRLQMWVVMQTVQQLQDRLYPKEHADFFGNTGATTFFAPQDQATAKFLSEMCGDAQYTLTTESESGYNPLYGTTGNSLKNLNFSTTRTPHIARMLSPEDARRIGPGRTINFIDPAPYPIVLETPGYWKLIPRGVLDPNPAAYHLG